MTGGRGAGDTTSEAQAGRRYVVRQGIPDSIILTENQGRTTAASLQSVADIMRANGLSRAILVSDPFHMLRLQILAYRYRMKCVTSPTRTSPISASPTEALEYVLSESVKAPITLLLSVFRS